ncbi:hypothetical protein QL285_078558 [Trifolium repens]|nr:hypothetical protein QL285_078558 [Trifolium repens]
MPHRYFIKEIQINQKLLIKKGKCLNARHILSSQAHDHCSGYMSSVFHYKNFRNFLQRFPTKIDSYQNPSVFLGNFRRKPAVRVARFSIIRFLENFRWKTYLTQSKRFPRNIS